MRKVITYGTFDVLHFGHIRLLERAKALGDYLIVGITSDDFDKARGKLNVEQPLYERIEAVKNTGLADEIVIEEYEGQKIDDIKRLGVDTFAIGSDWKGRFDYLKEFCEVVYLERTTGVSSSQLRSNKKHLRFGLAGQPPLVAKYVKEASFVNGLEVCGILGEGPIKTFEDLLAVSDAVYVGVHPESRYSTVKMALENDKHVLCESPICLNVTEYEELRKYADSRGLVLMDGIKTAYATAYNRLVLLLKGRKIGKIVSVDVRCTSMADMITDDITGKTNSICAWGPTALLPVFQICGTKFNSKRIHTGYLDKSSHFDRFSKIDFTFPDAVASVLVGKGIKSEGELIISGTEGYIYVPAPWWKTDYFEIRYENQNANKRFFYQLEGEGIRNMLTEFTLSSHKGNIQTSISSDITHSSIAVLADFYAGVDVTEVCV